MPEKKKVRFLHMHLPTLSVASPKKAAAVSKRKAVVDASSEEEEESSKKKGSVPVALGDQYDLIP